MDDRLDSGEGAVDIDAPDDESHFAADAWGRRAGLALRASASDRGLDEILQRGRRRQRVRTGAKVAGSVVVALVVVGGLALIAGDDQHLPVPPPATQLPDPFGAAGVGLVLYATPDGDIVSVDPATDTTATVIDEPSLDNFPNLAPDGTRFTFERWADGGPTALWIADVDGSDARELLHSIRGITWLEWAPDSQRIAAVSAGGDLTIRDVDSDQATTVDLDDRIVKVSWLPDDRLLVVLQRGFATRFAVTDEQGISVVDLPVAPDATKEWTLAPDGTKFAYMSWGESPSTEGRIHVFDLSTNTDTLLTPPGDGFAWENPTFSSDGTWLKVDRFDDTDTPLQVVLLAVDGSGDELLLGSPQEQYEGGTTAVFAPDSSQVAIRYNATSETYLFDTSTGSGSPVAWPDVGAAMSWQRVGSTDRAGE
jgi:dipeptidyl aminopeptidase/acylaminoacyl peptidase